MKDRLWFYGSYRNLDTQTAMEGINANANAGDAARWDWVGSPINARLVQDRQMIIGRLTGQLGKSRLAFNSEYQHRCEGTPLNVETQGCHNRGDDWIGLGNNAAPFQSPEATSTAARGYFDVPFYLNQGAGRCRSTNKLLLEAGYTRVPLQPDLRPSAAGRHHQPDPGHRAVERDQPGHRPAVRAAARTTRYRGVESVGMGGRQDRRLAGDGVLRHRRAQHEGRLPGQPAGSARSDDRRTRRSWLPLQPGRAERGHATGCRTSAAARSRTCTASSSRTAGRAAG